MSSTTVYNSTRSLTSRQMLNVNRDMKVLAGEMASGKKALTNISSGGLIQGNLIRTADNILEGATAASAVTRTNVLLAISALNGVADIFQEALDIANTCALDPTADYTKLSIEYLLMVGVATGYSRKTIDSTKDVKGTAIFALPQTVQVSPVAGDTITITPTFDVTDTGNYGGVVPGGITSATPTGSNEVVKMTTALKAVAAEIARLSDFIGMLDAQVGQMGEQIDSGIDALSVIADTDLPAASSQLNADIAKASMIGAVLNAKASLDSAITDAAQRILNRG